MLGISAILLGMSLPLIPASPLVATLTSSLPYANNDGPLQTATSATDGVSVEALRHGLYVVTLVNSHTAAIVTAHNQNLGSPPAFHDVRGIIPSGSTAIFSAPTGWAGRVAIAEVGIAIRDRSSLLEGSFVRQGSDLNAQIALDVSYVDGFTLPIVCECAGSVILGCNLNLLRMCPDQYRLDAGTCINPLRDGGDLSKNFFKDCSPFAYTYPTDDRATINGIVGCESNILCCVGTACAPHPQQKLCPAANGTMPCSSVAEPNSDIYTV